MKRFVCVENAWTIFNIKNRMPDHLLQHKIILHDNSFIVAFLNNESNVEHFISMLDIILISLTIK